MLKADFHIHTSNSKCSDMTPRTIVKAAIKKGYDVIGVVDHESIRGGLSVKRAAGKKLLVIPGEEIKTRYGEIIVFLSDGKYSNDLLEICERAKDMNHFVVVPHPFDYLRFSLGRNVEKIKKYVDAIEVFNSRVLINKFNMMAQKFARKNRIPKIAGSDAHFTEEIGGTTAFIDANKRTDSVLDAVKGGKLKYQGKRCPLSAHLKTTVRLYLRVMF